MNKKTLPPPPDFDSPEEAKDIIHFLWNKLAELEDRLNQNSRNSSEKKYRTLMDLTGFKSRLALL
ncbi:hypothetical protein FCV58_15125 [Vibrio sp. F13]|uniref:DUF6444 domain-containing protein n=1 Tax=Vibrio sp. F13 TaxID=2070777 RepID=UPI0010BDD126|nr:DUF6444 domain-containing protein [Vibrio sp. F13]TKF64204.1 hypothetical protein FCV58_15125 [Vibrio sp. F13]